MKIEKLSETKIKVTLSLNDIIRYNISSQNILQENELITDIIEKANKQTGITFDNCKLLIEVIQMEELKYIITITKKEIENTKQKTYKISKRKNKNNSVLVFEFDKFEDISVFARNNLFYCFLFDGKNSLYRDGKTLKLVVEISGELEKYLDAFSDRASEYANLIETGSLYSSYLGEHCNPIIKNNALKIIYYKL